MLYRVHLVWMGFELTTLVVIDTDFIGSYKSNYHTITTMTTPTIFQLHHDNEMMSTLHYINICMLSREAPYTNFIEPTIYHTRPASLPLHRRCGLLYRK